jgi:hypothetical protein
MHPGTKYADCDTLRVAVEYGSIGHSEERAKELFGDKNIEIYRK